MTLSLTSENVVRRLFLLVAALILLGAIGQISIHFFHHGRLFGLVYLFNLDKSRTLPDFYSVLALLFASLLALLMALEYRRLGDRDSRYWFGLGLLLLLLSYDEFSAIHSEILMPFKQQLKSHGVYGVAWILLYGLLVGVLLLLYRSFLGRLPRPTLRGFLIAAGLFLLGSVGFTLLQALTGWRGGWAGALLRICEESLEMLGVVVLIRTLLVHLEQQLGGVRIEIGAADKGRNQRDPEENRR